MDCIFCAIAGGDIPADIVHSSDRVVAFRDLKPVAPVHILVIPRAHYENVVDLAFDQQTAAEVLAVVAQVPESQGLTDGFRVVFNTGPDGGQEVGHVHAHVLGGRQMEWPPG